MYDNIGSKIKGLAMVICALEVTACVIGGLVLLAETGELIFALLLLFGPVVAWVSSWLLYGFGEGIEHLKDIEYNTRMSIHPEELIAIQEAKKQEIIKEEAIAAEENSVILYCYQCGEKLFFDKSLTQAECPYCGADLKIES